MKKNIIERVEDYLHYQKESFGDTILIDMPDNIIEVKSELINKDKPIVLKTASKLVDDNIKIELRTPDTSTINTEWHKSSSLPVLKENIQNCLECKLGPLRKNFVFGYGNPNAKIMIIGEAPGAEEDEQGLPFVGRAGQLLTKILESINLSREEVYIANIVKCRPPNNRRPEKDEVDTCEPYLKKQIEIINPEFILSLGLTSVDTLLKKTHKMAESRGQILDYHGKKMLVTYHPAALLRNPGWKKFVWEDVKLLRKLYDQYMESNL